MRLLFLGDIVGPPGLEFARRLVPVLRERWRLDAVVANAENASSGSGLFPNALRRLRAAGVDALTMGDHIYKRGEIIPVLATDSPIVKPANYPAAAPGRDHVWVTAADGTRLLVVSLMGRTFMRAVDCPFAAADRVLREAGAKADSCVLVDVHAEATADKYLLGHYLDGRVSCVFGTHTHVPTADEHVMPGGTAFQCDAGMTGPYDGVIGRRIGPVLATAIDFAPNPFDVATGDVRACGALADIDPTTGRARAVARVCVRADDFDAGRLPGAPIPPG